MILLLKVAFVLCCLAGGATHAAAPDDELLPGDARLAAIVTDPALPEMSGFAVSRRHPGVLWTHNDSGYAAEIHAVDATGERRATVRLRDIEAVDFEDIAAFDLDGEAFLLVGDVGDNGGLRGELRFHVLREPDLQDVEADVAWTVRFNWPDGPRDCEGVAVDAVAGEVLLASKKRVPAELFTLPLRPVDDQVQIARRVGLFAHIAQPSADDLVRNPVYGRYRAQITALDISPDRRSLAVLNYLRAHIYRRAEGESWSDAVTGKPQEVPYPWLAQAEAIAFDLDGETLWIGTERLPAPVLRLPVPQD